MSDSQINTFNNAAGDYTEANILQENSDSSTHSQYDNVQECNNSTISQVEQVAGGDSQSEKVVDANTKKNTDSNDVILCDVSQLQEKITKRTNECDEFRMKLEETEKKLAAFLKLSPNNEVNNVDNHLKNNSIRSQIEDLRNILLQAKHILDDRERRISNQENQIAALTKQVHSLKEVVTITKDMFNIRNLEVKHLQEDVDKMEMKIAAERDRHNIMCSKMDVAAQLNADLKKEYQTQLQLFHDLKSKYEEKVMILSEENKALEMAIQNQPAQ